MIIRIIQITHKNTSQRLRGYLEEKLISEQTTLLGNV